MKLEIAIYRPTECSYTRFIKESFRSHLFKRYFICTVLYSVYILCIKPSNLRIINFHILLYNKVTGAGKKSLFSSFIFEEATEARSECKQETLKFTMNSKK